MSSESTTRKQIRFSIAFVLFFAMCVAGTLAGYRAGFHQGYASGSAKRDSEQPYPQVYRVGDLIRYAAEDQQHAADRPEQPLDFQSLVDAIQTTVFPDEWEALGGPCGMAAMPLYEALVVNATSGVHDRIEIFLTDLTAAKVAIADSRQEHQEMMAARDAYLNRIFDSASERVGQELTPVPGDMVLEGTWEVHSEESGALKPMFKYVFGDNNSVTVSSLQDVDQAPAKGWFLLSPAYVVVSGTSYLAATTSDGDLVLVHSSDSDVILVATKNGYRGQP